MDTQDLLNSLPCLALAAVALGYLTRCAISPFGRCRDCKTPDPNGSQPGPAPRECRRCAGTGLRLRSGCHLIHLLKDEYEAAKR